ncbi:hypothetical protein NliqN6_2149 [Naganishia liquefaciens]|uniref:Cdc23 domain-containing protein n=1 Tax=Naganishia liquefaciens TaxID=104408 RepID=A0A8H3TR96_9TREE|nr:hypothetical protein NliqN6_2149 [Naganishia liquefaciens]
MSTMRMLNRDLLSETDLSPEQLNQLAVDLRQAVKECKDRGLLSAAKWANELLVSIPADQRKPALPEFQPRHSMASEAEFADNSPYEPSRHHHHASGRRSSIATPSKSEKNGGPSGSSTPASLRRVIANRKQQLHGGIAPARYSTASSISMSIDSGSAPESSTTAASRLKAESPLPTRNSPIQSKTFGQRRTSRFSLGEVFSVRPSRRREPLDLGLGDLDDAEGAGDDSGMLPMEEETEEVKGDTAGGLISPELAETMEEVEEFDMEMTGEGDELPSRAHTATAPVVGMPYRSADVDMDQIPGLSVEPTNSINQHGRFISEWEIEKSEQDLFEMGKSYYDTKELERCYEMLGRCRSKKAKFLRLYSKYLSADRKSQDMMPHFMDTKAETEAIAPYVYPILDDLQGENDAYLLYLKGILYLRLAQKDLAMECFILSVQVAQYNWSCWLSIAQCIGSTSQFVAIKESLPRGIMFNFFAVHVMLDLHSATEMMLQTVNDLQKLFPTSSHLTAAKALTLYHMRNFEEAEKAFDGLREMDPFRLDEIEIYSNMLYVMNKKAKLAQIAHEYAQIDKNRAEVCCLIGNYFSSRDEHVKAIQYFKRSLQLNRDYLPAWTLMGHEFVELKNSHAAIEAYRRAVDVNPKDYRAWYGLGQVYELLDMHYYAIQYYNRATALRPYDCRMWEALATVYEHLERDSDAIECHNRALLGADAAQTLAILTKLAHLHDEFEQFKAAAAVHRRYIKLAEEEGRNIGEMAASYLYLAEYELDLLHRPANDTFGEGDEENTDGKKRLGCGRKSEKDTSAESPDMETVELWLRRVIESGASEREAAEEDLRHLHRLLERNRLVASSPEV